MGESTLRDTQYRPVSTKETATDDALSVRAVREFAWSINNAFARACAPVYPDAWPGGDINYTDNDTDEHVALRFAGVFYGEYGHYNYVTWSINGIIGASSNDCIWRLYSSERRYVGPDVITSTLKPLMGAYDVDSITIDSTSSQVEDSVETLEAHTSSRYETYFLLTYEFDAASADNDATLYTLVITGAHVKADI